MGNNISFSFKREGTVCPKQMLVYPLPSELRDQAASVPIRLGELDAERRAAWFVSYGLGA